MILRIARDLASLIASAVRSRAQLAAENLYLKKQLALYLERQVKPPRADDTTRLTLVVLSRFVEWRRLLTIVKPDGHESSLFDVERQLQSAHGLGRFW